MNATDHVYGYHLRDVYKDMENLKYDNTKLQEVYNELYNIHDNTDVLNGSLSNLISDSASTSHRIDAMESNVNRSISHLTNDVEHLKHDTHKGLAQANALSSLK